MAIPSIVQNHHSSILSLLFFHHLWVNETLAREGWKRETTKSERLPTSSHAHACPACRSYSIVGCGFAGWQGPKSNVNCYIYLRAKQQRGFSAVHWYFHFILNAILYACFTVFFPLPLAILSDGFGRSNRRIFTTCSQLSPRLVCYSNCTPLRAKLFVSQTVCKQRTQNHFLAISLFLSQIHMCANTFFAPSLTLFLQKL